MAGSYPGGFITKSPVTTVGPSGEFNEGGSASGMWTLDQALGLKAAGLWPSKTKEKFLWSWGLGSYGSLGDGTGINRSSPVQIGALTTWSLISAHTYHSMAIKTDGTMWAWGTNTHGLLGVNTTIARSSPIQVGALTTWSKIDAGVTFSMALKTDGTMWTWGKNSGGWLGDNTAIYKSSPVQVGALTTWSQISAGNNHSMAIKTDGTLWTFGYNTGGKLGENSIGGVPKSSPIQIGALTTWSLVSAGDYQSVAIKTDGTLWSWGQNTYGQLGDNTSISRSSPVQIGALTTWRLISGNLYHSMAIKTDGTLWTWGKNTPHGKLGDDTVINKSSPVQIGALTTWSLIAGGRYHSMAIKTDGTMWAWGYDGHGQTGGNTDGIPKSSPVQVGTLTTWAKVAAGNFNLAISAV